MKSISSELMSAIVSGNVCTLFSIEAPSGLKAYFTDHDEPISYNGKTWNPTPGIRRLAMNLNNSAQVSNQKVGAAIVDLPKDQLAAGLWDSARVTCYLYGWAMDTPEAMIVVSGTLGAIVYTDETFSADVQGLVRDLAKSIGKTVTPTCRHRLYDFGTDYDSIGSCGVDPDAHKVTPVTVTAVLSARAKFKCSSGEAHNWATTGYVEWLTGDNAGRTYMVKIHEVNDDSDIGESVELWLPTGMPIQVGDTFALYEGCDHTTGHCHSRFNNILNFGGFPHLQVDQNATVNLT